MSSNAAIRSAGAWALAFSIKTDWNKPFSLFVRLFSI